MGGNCQPLSRAAHLGATWYPRQGSGLWGTQGEDCLGWALRLRSLSEMNKLMAFHPRTK